MFEIRKIDRHEDFEGCVDLQKRVWGFADRDALPSRTILIAQKFGGCVLGAYVEGRLVGFSIALASYYEGSFAQHSHMLAVLPEFQNQGIGEHLKLAQRRDALERGIKLITWTFDPLEAKNAHLNLNKLGVLIRNYFVNFYPSNSSEVYSGLGTDRFLAEWWIRSNRVKNLLGDEMGALSKPIKTKIKGGNNTSVSNCEDLVSDHRLLNSTSYSAEHLLSSTSPVLELSDPKLVLEIPPEIKMIRAQNPELAKDWREKTRKALKHYLERGYIVTKLAVKKSPGSSSERKTFYLLEEADLQSLRS